MDTNKDRNMLALEQNKICPYTSENASPACKIVRKKQQAKTIVIHQPDFIPYLGFFERILFCDLFVTLDHVQLLKRGWHNRDQIKGPNGAHWLTIPINRTDSAPPINQAIIEYSQKWPEKHLKTITQFYKKAPFFDLVFPDISTLYNQKHSLLIDFNMALLTFFLKFFSISTEIIFSSQLNIQTHKSQLIFDIVKQQKGTHYLTGTGSKDYLEETLFTDAGITVYWKEFHSFVYPQLHGEFIPYLSCLDFAMNCGPNLHQKLTRS